MLKHRTLLKSIISFTKDQKEIDFIINNFHVLHASNVLFNLDTHSKIYAYICKHVSKFVDVPSYDRIKKQFEEDPEAKEELEAISKEALLYSSNFKSLLSEVFEEQQKRDLITLLKETSQISESGKKIKNKFIQGPRQAVEHFLFKSLDYLKTEIKVKTQGFLKGDSKEAIEDYFEIKNKNKFDGLLVGLESVDLICKGIRPTELWLIMAYVSELKSTLSMNFAYTQSIEQRANVKFLSLEMPYKTVRNIFICIHSSNLNLWPQSEWDDVYPLNFDAVMEGTLTEREEQFFKFLCEDLDNNSEYGRLHIYQPEEGLTMSHLKAWSEIEFRKESFDIIYLDYIELMRDDSKTGDYTVDLNQRIKDLKQFALHFNEGQGLRIVSAYQANRKGKEYADKHDGEYRLDALSYANEAERSADVIMYSYLNDELRANNQTKIGCLKNRSRPKFKQFVSKTNLSSRKIFEIPNGKTLDEKFKENNNNKKAYDELIMNI